MNVSVHSILKDSESKLRAAGLPLEDAAILIAYAIGVDRGALFAHPERACSAEEYIHIEQSLAKRLAGYSVAAITGHKEFYGLDFIVNEHTLIPRPETELLVEKALEYLRNNDHQIVLDMGTGCGCIIIALAKNVEQQRHILFYAADVSGTALAVARHNARRYKTAIHFYHSNLFEQLHGQRYTLIIANLPYLRTDQLREASIRREPVGALWGGSDGLDIYRAFLNQAREHVSERFCILLEIDPSQYSAVHKNAQEVFPEARITITPDLAGHQRLVSIIS